MKIAFVVAAAAAVLTTAPLATPTKAQEQLKMAQVDVQIGRDRDRYDRDRRRDDATVGTTATIGTADEMTPPSASAQVALGSAHDSAAAWRPPRSSGTTAAVSRAGSAVATKRKGRLRGRRWHVNVLCPQAGTRNDLSAPGIIYCARVRPTSPTGSS